MVSTSADVFSPICCENPCRDSEGRVQLLDSLLNTGVERRKRSASPVEKGNQGLPRRTGSWVFMPRRTKEEETTPTPETRSVLLRGSVIQQNMTGLASIETRSRGLQTAALPTTRSADTQTTDFTTHKGSLQRWRSIEGKYWLELQRCQHRVKQIIVQTRDPNGKLPDRAPIAALEELRDRIKSISLNMNSLKQKLQCGSGSWLRPQSPSRPAGRLRAPTDHHHHCEPASAEKRRHRTAKKKTRWHRWGRLSKELSHSLDSTEPGSGTHPTSAE